MEVKTPDLGVENAEVSELLVAVGDNIAKEDNIVVLESDKASVEVPSSEAGKVTNILVSVGDQVSEGVVLIEVEPAESGSEDKSTDINKDNEYSGDDSSPDSSNNNGVGEDNSKDKATYKNSSSNEDAESKQSTSNEVSETTHALPDLGVDEAQIAEVMVNEGDEVDEDQPILLVESDKASVEVPAPATGKVVKLLVSNGDTVSNGQDYVIIASHKTIDDIDNEAEDKSADSTSSATRDSDAKADNSAQKPDDNQSSNRDSKMHGATTSRLSEQEVNDKLTDVYAGPAVRKLARQLGVDITQVSGSAVNNRIVKEDLFGYVKAQMNQSAMSSQSKSRQSVAAQTGLPSLPDMTKTDIWGELDTQDLSRLQKVSIPQLTLNTYLPQVTQFDLADITDTESLRGELKGDFKKQGIGLTILAFIVKATAYALTQHPKFNSHLSDDNSQIIVRKTVNMGIAVATDDGLIVPVIKDAQAKGIKQIAIEIGELAAKARDKKLTTKDLQGASFTISSQGNLGGTYFTPLVNWPQVGILGVSEASIQPRWQEDSQSFKPRLMLPLSLSYDHRVINGADAAVFTRYVATLLADPRRILL